MTISATHSAASAPIRASASCQASCSTLALSSRTRSSRWKEDKAQFAAPTIPRAPRTATSRWDGARCRLRSRLGTAKQHSPICRGWRPLLGNEGSPIIFDGSASSSICGFPTLQWNFSDGGVADGVAPQHTFEAPGTYSGLLTATDATGLTATTTFSVGVANLPPVVDAGPNVSTEWDPADPQRERSRPGHGRAALPHLRLGLRRRHAERLGWLQRGALLYIPWDVHGDAHSV